MDNGWTPTNHRRRSMDNGPDAEEPWSALDRQRSDTDGRWSDQDRPWSGTDGRWSDADGPGSARFRPGCDTGASPRSGNAVGAAGTIHTVTLRYVELYTNLPPATVIVTFASRIVSGGTRVMSRSIIVKSASLPRTRLPFSFSSNDAYAALIV